MSRAKFCSNQSSRSGGIGSVIRIFPRLPHALLGHHNVRGVDRAFHQQRSRDFYPVGVGSGPYGLSRLTGILGDAVSSIGRGSGASSLDTDALSDLGRRHRRHDGAAGALLAPKAMLVCVARSTCVAARFHAPPYRLRPQRKWRTRSVGRDCPRPTKHAAAQAVRGRQTAAGRKSAQQTQPLTDD